MKENMERVCVKLSKQSWNMHGKVHTRQTPSEANQAQVSTTSANQSAV